MALTDTLWSNWMGCSPWLSGPWKWKSSRRPNYESPTLASDEPFRVLIHPLTGFDWAVLRLSVIDHWKDRLRDNQRRSGVARRGNRCLTGDRVATSRQTLSPQTPSRLVHGHKINVPDADAAALQMINRALSHARSKKSGLTRFSLFKGSTFHRERNQRISRFRLSYKTYNFFFVLRWFLFPYDASAGALYVISADWGSRMQKTREHWSCLPCLLFCLRGPSPPLSFEFPWNFSSLLGLTTEACHGCLFGSLEVTR